MSIVEQLANIGGEIGRAVKWRQKNNPAYSGKAAERALELIDFTLDDPKNIKRLREIARLREAAADYFFGDNTWGSTDKSWSRYVSHFATAARRAG